MRIAPIILLIVGLVVICLGFALDSTEGQPQPEVAAVPVEQERQKFTERVPEQTTPVPTVQPDHRLYGMPQQREARRADGPSRSEDAGRRIGLKLEPASDAEAEYLKRRAEEIRQQEEAKFGEKADEERLRQESERQARLEELKRRSGEVTASTKKKPPEPGEAVSVREQTLYDRLSRSMRSARYAFNHPESMYLARRSQITLALAEDESVAVHTLIEQFEKDVEGAIKTGETKYAPVMVATLRGKDFKIEPPGGQERLVLLNKTGPLAWTWFVEPREAGVGKLIVLELSARLARANENLPPLVIKTFEARINVDVRTWDRVLIHAQRMSPVSQALTGAGGFVAVIGFIGTARRWFGGRKRNGKTTKLPPPLPVRGPPPLPVQGPSPLSPS
jgi:hypothetical protein